MKMEGRRGTVSVVLVGPCKSDFHASRSSIRGVNASISVTDNFDVEEVSNRVALRRFVGAEEDGISSQGGREGSSRWRPFVTMSILITRHLPSASTAKGSDRMRRCIIHSI